MFSTFYKKEQNIWHGNDIQPLYNPEISLAQALLHSMTMFGSKIAQISDDSGVEKSFDEIKMETIRAAQNLQKIGIKRNQVVALSSRNHHNVAPITFASIAIGCAVNTLSPTFGKAEYLHMLKITKPVLVFCEIDSYQLISECLTEIGISAKIFTFGGSVGQSEPVENLFVETHKEDEFIPVKVDGGNDIAIIVCTSGTTGLPKGVCLSHATLLNNYSRRSDVGYASDVVLCLSPLFWMSGVGILLRGTLFGSTRIITTEGFTPETMLRMIEQYKITYCMNSTYHIIVLMNSDRFHKTDLSSLKYILTGGAKVPFHVKTEMRRHMPNGHFIVGYGCSETGGPISYDLPMAIDKEDTVGRLVDGMCIKIVDDHGNRCGVNENGEICVKMIHKFRGYYDNESATNDILDDEGFIQTGDIGHFDDDGDLCLVGRKKELLKYCSMQISPSDIDSYLTQSPDIQLACVVGIPDEMSSDLPAALIVRAPQSNISEQDVYDMVANHFADHYKLRGGIYFVDSLPTTATGKILRRDCTKIAIEFYNKLRNNKS